MVNKILKLKKEITELSDREEYLYDDEYERLKGLKEEYEAEFPKLSDYDKKIIEEEFSRWYEKYIYFEAVGNIRLPEG
ncbi:hypothetical protein Flexsi_1756 [Flexistipes sinusarabici DSM 4947]|uniref:Uncharacterized protein n=1 Tax=Flexistipes sinusarabici (strain ATCC 49648 / DSM 4947 / MAS 10) TaxID=717231 RepID=F8E9Y5_FLESM|nr:hypothetical protein [Flexistipes sinusarabici]AEI15396.1 hypothetical protein Flexsi_1756 [Flexistipes sinusarabici DSM 4947]